MDNIFIVAAIISLVFFISKFIEMRFVEKETKPLKLLIRDSLLVYFSVFIYINDFFQKTLFFKFFKIIKVKICLIILFKSK